jgi:Lrp/AsnC family leucine-responsive transcriptional regulator
MDETDRKIIDRLMDDGRVTWKKLAIDLSVSAPTIAERVRRMEKENVILAFRGIMNPGALGYDLAAFVAVTLARPEDREAFLKKVTRLPEIQECHHIAGDYDYLLKVRCASTKALDRLISSELKGLKGIVRTQTTIVLDSMKESTSLPRSGK